MNQQEFELLLKRGWWGFVVGKSYTNPEFFGRLIPQNGGEPASIKVPLCTTLDELYDALIKTGEENTPFKQVKREIVKKEKQQIDFSNMSAAQISHLLEQMKKRVK
jgi:predicted CopG family antitoxin